MRTIEDRRKWILFCEKMTRGLIRYTNRLMEIVFGKNLWIWSSSSIHFRYTKCVWQTVHMPWAIANLSAKFQLEKIFICWHSVVNNFRIFNWYEKSNSDSRRGRFSSSSTYLISKVFAMNRNIICWKNNLNVYDVECHSIWLTLICLVVIHSPNIRSTFESALPKTDVQSVQNRCGCGLIWFEWWFFCTLSIKNHAEKSM